jgi:hypothetical protein
VGLRVLGGLSSIWGREGRGGGGEAGLLVVGEEEGNAPL